MNLKNLDDVKYKIHKIKILNENDKRAKSILSKAAEQVLPIMRKRRFSVELLSEFLPKSPNLLGLNIVSKSEIKIRLRKKRGGEIFHFNDIVGTLLHELAHIVHSRHDKSFYELLDSLILEYNELYVYNNRSSHACVGKKIGSSKKNIYNTNPKLMAAEAAEKRLINNFISKDGQIVNLSLESCLTPEQYEYIFKNRKEHDDKICSLNQEVIIIDPITNSSKNVGRENEENSLNVKKKNSLTMTILESKEINEDINTGIKEDISKGINKDINTGIKEDISKGINKDISMGINKDISTGINKDISTGINKDISKDINEDISNGINEDINTGINKSTHKNFVNSNIYYVRDTKYPHVQIGSESFLNVQDKNQKIEYASKKECNTDTKDVILSNDMVTIPEMNGGNSVHILKVKRGRNKGKNTQKGNYSIISDNLYNDKNKRRKIIVLD
ncbi:metalloprotease [Plasmodium brasilianum]|uniref:Metallopeptidase, putative n=2 Tax=Plasmodium (Plasmodium) TaxID=418103 RepID=A0A1A8VV34_PLAMA|nr:metallopeptidase, putative [Plasmodium malariae]KAI4838789.1 metalloprotease [Plasmodium brasilianum]SBS84349.1 metallopeptidase, putative [Plasmodium malariae]SCN12129.1 metallopeptidase, putative [Plasmodium malariae]